MASAARVWFVTGTSTGLGHALARQALERGDRVVATSRDPSAVETLQKEYPERAVAIALDVTDPNAAVQAVDQALAVLGRIDVLVNNAGYGSFGALEEMPLEDLRRQFETNVFGMWHVTRAVLPVMRSQRAGHIVQVSSLDGIAPLGPGESAYAGSKFAVEGISEVLAAEVAHLGIKVTIVEPGPVRTPFGEAAKVAAVELPDYQDSVGKALEWFESMQGAQPNDPDAVAQAVVDAVTSENPPLRLALGQEAVEAIRTKLAKQRDDLDAWERVSVSTGAD
jgi:NAD(P)-dependent dehydrogenase (short-subunit alcohol dehydrogenase family)